MEQGKAFDFHEVVGLDIYGNFEPGVILPGAKFQLGGKVLWEPISSFSEVEIWGYLAPGISIGSDLPQPLPSWIADLMLSIYFVKRVRFDLSEGKQLGSRWSVYLPGINFVFGGRIFPIEVDLVSVAAMIDIVSAPKQIEIWGYMSGGLDIPLIADLGKWILQSSPRAEFKSMGQLMVKAITNVESVGKFLSELSQEPQPLLHAPST